MKLENLKLIKESLEDPRFGLINIFEDKISKKLVMTKETTTYSKHTHRKNKKKLKIQKSLKTSNLQKLLYSTIDDENYIIKTYYKYPPNNLLSKMTKLRTIKEMVKFLKNLLKGMNYLEKKKLVMKNIKPEFVYYDLKKDRYCYVGEFLDVLDCDGFLEDFKNDRNCFFGPEIFDQLFRNDFSGKFQFFKIGVFNLGVVGLLIFTNEDIVGKIYDFQNERFDVAVFEKIKRRLIKKMFREKYLEDFKNFFFEDMLNLDIDKRKSASECYARIRKIERYILNPSFDKRELVFKTEDDMQNFEVIKKQNFFKKRNKFGKKKSIKSKGKTVAFKLEKPEKTDFNKIKKQRRLKKLRSLKKFEVDKNSKEIKEFLKRNKITLKKDEKLVKYGGQYVIFKEEVFEEEIEDDRIDFESDFNSDFYEEVDLESENVVNFINKYGLVIEDNQKLVRVNNHYELITEDIVEEIIENDDNLTIDESEKESSFINDGEEEFEQIIKKKEDFYLSDEEINYEEVNMESEEIKKFIKEHELKLENNQKLIKVGHHYELITEDITEEDILDKKDDEEKLIQKEIEIEDEEEEYDEVNMESEEIKNFLKDHNIILEKNQRLIKMGGNYQLITEEIIEEDITDKENYINHTNDKVVEMFVENNNDKNKDEIKKSLEEELGTKKQKLCK